MDDRRTSPRMTVFAPATVQLCDPATLAPKGQQFEAVVVDLSLGGVRMGIASIPALHTLEAGTKLRLDFKVPDLKIKAEVYLHVSWFRRATAAGFLSTAGGYFDQIHEADRAALVRFAASYSAAPRAARGRVSHLRFAITGISMAIAVAALLQACVQARQVQALTRQLQGQTTLVEEQQTQIRALSEATSCPPRADRHPRARIGPMPGDVVPARAVDDEEKATALDLSMRPPVLEDLEIASLEVIGTDFVGRIQSTRDDARAVRVAIDYPCAHDERCRCDTQPIRVSAQAIVEFACTPKDAPGADLKHVDVTLK